MARSPERLTSRQAEILRWIQGHIRLCGWPPTLREIGEAFGIRSTNGVNDHLRALERKGWLWRDTARARCMRLLRRPPKEESDAV